MLASQFQLYVLCNGLSHFLGNEATYSTVYRMLMKSKCALELLLQVVKELVNEWWTARCPHGVKKRGLYNRVLEVGWRRHLDKNLDQQLYVAQAVPHSTADLQEEDEQEEVAIGGTAIKTMVTAATSSRSSTDDIGAGVFGAAYEGDPTSSKLLNPLMTFASPQERIAQVHADRWTEESLCREMLDDLDWASYCPRDRRDDLYKVFELGMKYVDEFENGVINSWKMDDAPVHMRVWLAELEWTWRTLMSRGWLPQDCRCPHDRYIRERATGAEGHVDPGNMVYDTMVNLLRMWKAVDVLHYSNVVKAAGKEYGQTGNKSAAGPVNLRGNIVESLLRWTQQMGSTPNLPPQQRWSCQEWYLGWYD